MPIMRVDHCTARLTCVVADKEFSALVVRILVNLVLARGVREVALIIRQLES